VPCSPRPLAGEVEIRGSEFSGCRVTLRVLHVSFGARGGSSPGPSPPQVGRFSLSTETFIITETHLALFFLARHALPEHSAPDDLDRRASKQTTRPRRIRRTGFGSARTVVVPRPPFPPDQDRFFFFRSTSGTAERTSWRRPSTSKSVRQFFFFVCRCSPAPRSPTRRSTAPLFPSRGAVGSANPSKHVLRETWIHQNLMDSKQTERTSRVLE